MMLGALVVLCGVYSMMMQLAVLWIICKGAAESKTMDTGQKVMFYMLAVAFLLSACITMASCWVQGMALRK